MPEVSIEVQRVINELGEFNYSKCLISTKRVEERQPIVIENGSIYLGEWDARNNKREGKGKILFIDGSLFEGGFSKNQINGFGRYIKHDGECYEGTWENDTMTGYGILTTPEGYKYSGNWNDGK